MADEIKQRPSQVWLDRIQEQGKNFEPWVKNAEKVVKRFEDDREGAKLDLRDQSRVNILWANTEILAAALNPDKAHPDVRRRFTETSQTKLSRTVSTVLERSMSFEADNMDLGAEEGPINKCLYDYLLPGRGAAWVSYDVDLDDKDNIRRQELKVDRVYWKDFRHSEARIWSDVWWVARKHEYSRPQFRKQFPKAKFDQAAKTDVTKKDEKTSTKRVDVWEVWDKVSRKRYYVTEGVGDFLKEDDDPYGLKDFFPCPPPVYSVARTDNLRPKPEFELYRDLAGELDEVTTRIHRLTQALKWNGIYDASADDGSKVLTQMSSADDGVFLPHQNFAHFRDKGGIEAAYGFRPIERIFPVVQALMQHRTQLIQGIYEVTGISDIVRGATDPRETRGAQQLKAQFGSMRMQKRQREWQEFVRGIYRIMAELISEHYQPEILAEMTGVELPTQEMKLQVKAQLDMAQRAGATEPPQIPDWYDDPTWNDVMEVLRTDKRRGYSISVETDQTALQDEDAEKNRRIEFLQAITGTLEQAYTAATTAPAAVPLIKEMTMFAVRSFKAGRPIEESIEDAFKALQENPPPPQEEKKATGPDPQIEMAKLQQKEEDSKRKDVVAHRDLDIKEQNVLMDHDIDQANVRIKERDALIDADQQMEKRYSDERQTIVRTLS